MAAELRDAQPGTISLPRSACWLRDEGDVTVGEGDSRAFSMVALTGKPLSHWYYGTLGIDLQGIQLRQKLPVLQDHRTDQRLGYTRKVTLGAGGLLAEGVLLDNEAANAIKAEAKAGFPWQASTYLQATRVERVANGETAELNGGTLTGPAVIFRASILREVTFCVLGADDDTSATPLSGDIADQRVTATLSERQNMAKQNEAATADKGAAAPAEQDNTVALNAARKEALEQERRRAAVILGACAAEQAELAAKLVADGASIEEALLAINKDLRQRVTDNVAPRRTSATLSLARGNAAADEPVTDEAAKLAAQPEGENKWKQQWAASAELRDEFNGSEAAWCAFKKNEHRCRDHGRAV
jgi:hypothetical protein